MSLAVREMHAFEAAAKAGREPYKVRDLSLAEFGRKEIGWPGDAGPDGLARATRTRLRSPARRSWAAST